MKRLIFLVLVLALVPLVSSEIATLGNFVTGESVNLVQTCDNCTFVNMTKIQLPNSTILTINEAMQRTGADYNYTFKTTSTVGEYQATTCGDVDGTLTCVVYNFFVTRTGTDIGTGQSILYVILLVIFVIMFFGFMFWTITLPSKNERNFDGEITSINWKKYAKWGSAGMSYLLAVAIVFFAWNLTYAFLNFDGMALFLRFLYTLLLGLALPIGILGLIYLLVIFYGDKKVQKMLERGFVGAI